jgi:molecular chaperone GrpE
MRGINPHHDQNFRDRISMTDNKTGTDENTHEDDALANTTAGLSDDDLQELADALAEEGGEASLLDELREENATLKDRVLRAMAETENLRKRAEREKAEATLYAATNFARDLLSVGDSLSRALEIMNEDVRAEADEPTRQFIEGIELTRRELLNSFQKHGIVEVMPEGEKFDPNFHQAMFEVPGTDKPSGTIVQVVQTGYKIGERVLRPALVGVAKGDPAAKNTAGKS